jgi:4-amino-4-deoxy-L-arabinose transferase-like glycosyltransferase
MSRTWAVRKRIAGLASSGRTQVIPAALLAGLIVFHLVNNLVWRRTNVIVFGFDRMFHQVTSLAYYDMLRDGVNLHTLFAALTWSDYYPPLVHLTAAAFYGLFGLSMDVAAMANSLYLVLLLVAVYDIGRRLAGPWVGLLAAFVVSTFPIVFAMSRYLYIDFGLMAMVAVSVCLLLRTDHFRHKGYSLLFGLSLGLGLLVKWTFAAFVAAPLLVVIARSGAVRSALRSLRPPAWRGRRLLAAGLAGLALTALWFVPNVEATRALPLGFSLVPLSWLIWTLALYFALLPAGPGVNLLAALGLGGGVASAWYLTKINFFGTFWLNAYGKGTGRSWGFGPYLDFLVHEQLSPLYAVVLLLVLALLAWQRWRRTRSWRGFLALGTEGWVLVLWFAVSYGIFSSQVSIIHSRYIMPLLPPLAVAIALGLSRIPGRSLRAGAVAAVGVLAAFQFAALTFDAFGPLQEKVPVLADGLSIQLPASGRTDPGYWVAPDVLGYVEEHQAGDAARLGILINSNQVNSKQFIYLAYTTYPGVQIDELAAVGRDQGIYGRLFACDFVLLVDPAPHYPRRPEMEATLQRLVTSADDTFHRAFDLARVYPLPDGTRLLLYQRRFAALHDVDMAYYESLMADLAQKALPHDAVVVVPPEQVYALAQAGDGSVPLYPLPPEARPPAGADLARLEEIGAEYERLWVVRGESQAADPGGLLSNRLVERFYRAEDTWYGPLELVLYGPPAEAGTAAGLHETEITWQAGIALLGYRFVETSVPPGQIVRLDLSWQATEPIGEPYKVFLHLLDGDGQVTSQRDSEPVAGTRPTTSWVAGEPVADRYGLNLPVDLPPGDYRLVLGLYPAAGGERLIACCPQADAILLARVHVADGTASILVPHGN